jgi:hypothetical protein
VPWCVSTTRLTMLCELPRQALDGGVPRRRAPSSRLSRTERQILWRSDAPCHSAADALMLPHDERITAGAPCSHREDGGWRRQTDRPHASSLLPQVSMPPSRSGVSTAVYAHAPWRAIM